MQPGREQVTSVQAIETLGGRVYYGDLEKPSDIATSEEKLFADVTKVNLYGPQIDDAALEQIQKHLEGFSRLQSLDLDETKVTDAGLKNLEGLTRLQSLGLHGEWVT